MVSAMNAQKTRHARYFLCPTMPFQPPKPPPPNPLPPMPAPGQLARALDRFVDLLPGITMVVGGVWMIVIGAFPGAWL